MDEAGLPTPDSLPPTDNGEGAIPRRTPVAVLRPPLDLCVSTGVTLDSDSRVIVMGDEGGVGKALVDRLGKLDVDVLVLDPTLDDEAVLSSIDDWAGENPVTGVYWLPALDVEAPIADMALDDWRGALRLRVKLLYETMRHLYDRVSGSGTFLVSATRLGGRHGFDAEGPPAPMGGAVTGFTKTFKREKPQATVKAVDFPVSRKTAGIADALIEETLTDPGVVEVGRTDDGHRWTVAMSEVELPDEASGLDLGSDSVFVVTGAAGSIVSAITADLAAASGGTFVLLDLVPEPDRGNDDIARFRTDPDGLRLDIFERLKTSGERATPAVVEMQMGQLERASAALSAIEAIESAGGTVEYHSVNLLDGEAMAAVMAHVSESHEKVDVLLHAGGLEISRLLPDKERSEYDLVFDVKADGWFNLLNGLGGVDIGATVAFSSIAGRFGNAGQPDYSAANDLLAKYSLAMEATSPGTSGIVIDWTAWGDIGMATRGSIPTVMKAAGIDMLPAAIGVPYVRHEITGEAGSREIVVAGSLGMLLEEWHETGGLDVDAVASASDGSLLVGDAKAFGLHGGFTVETTLDPMEQGFLDDHRIDGTPVFPGVMGMEAFAEAASAPFDLVVSSIRDVSFAAPFKFYKDEPRDFAVNVRYEADGDDIVAYCTLIGTRILPTLDEPQVTEHFSATVVLSAAHADLGSVSVPDESDPVGAEDVYRIYFHGPTYQVLDRAWSGDGVAVGVMAGDLPANQDPEDAELITGPRLTELCFQTAGVWGIGTTGTMALPMQIDLIEFGVVSPSEDGVTAVVTAGGNAFDASVVDGDGNVLARLTGYRTVSLPGALDDGDVAPLRRAMGADG